MARICTPRYPAVSGWVAAVSVMGVAVVSPQLVSATGCPAPSFSPATSFDAGREPHFIAVGDFTGDGNLDLAVAIYGFPAEFVSVLLGTGTGSFGVATSFRAGSYPTSLAVGDLNGDGNQDLVVANQGSGSVSILLGTGTGSFSDPTEFGVGPSPGSVAVADFNGDSNLDLAVNGFDDTVSVLLGTGSGSFGPFTNFPVGPVPAAVAVGDFNRDGKLDVVTANHSGTVSILLGTGTGSFGAATNFEAGPVNGPNTVSVGDFNGDRKLDLAVSNQISDDVAILLGTGTGSFGAATGFHTGFVPTAVGVGDFNGDGNLDLAVTNSYGPVSILLGTGTGSFGAATNFVVGGDPISVAVGDFDGDGLPDVAVTNVASANVSVLINACSPPPRGPAAPALGPLGMAVTTLLLFAVGVRNVRRTEVGP